HPGGSRLAGGGGGWGGSRAGGAPPRPGRGAPPRGVAPDSVWELVLHGVSAVQQPPGRPGAG
ncbi:hypothetical protein ACFWP7_00980, partial [Streptomyces sp. NPDC058470]